MYHIMNNYSLQLENASMLESTIFVMHSRKMSPVIYSYSLVTILFFKYLL